MKLFVSDADNFGRPKWERIPAKPFRSVDTADLSPSESKILALVRGIGALMLAGTNGSRSSNEVGLPVHGFQYLPVIK